MRFSNYKVLRSIIAPKAPHESVYVKQIIIPSFKSLESKFKNFPKQFELITDFDFTLTKYQHNNNSVSTINMVTVLFI